MVDGDSYSFLDTPSFRFHRNATPLKDGNFGFGFDSAQPPLSELRSQTIVCAQQPETLSLCSATEDAKSMLSDRRY